MAVSYYQATTLNRFGFKNPLSELDKRSIFIGGDKMKMKVNPIVDFKDGVHKGKIVGIEERTEPFHYLDFEIEETETKLRLKVGYPAFISLNSKLGQLIQRFGFILEENADFDTDALLSKKCSFQTHHIKGKDGKDYCNIISDTVKGE